MPCPTWKTHRVKYFLHSLLSKCGYMGSTDSIGIITYLLQHFKRTIPQSHEILARILYHLFQPYSMIPLITFQLCIDHVKPCTFHVNYWISHVLVNGLSPYYLLMILLWCLPSLLLTVHKSSWWHEPSTNSNPKSLLVKIKVFKMCKISNVSCQNQAY